jgi:hypothetical protein
MSVLNQWKERVQQWKEQEPALREWFAPACTFPAQVHDIQTMQDLITQTDCSAGYDRVSFANRLSFPRDSLPHYGFRNEWWTWSDWDTGRYIRIWRHTMIPPSLRPLSNDEPVSSTSVYMVESTLDLHTTTELYSDTDFRFDPNTFGWTSSDGRWAIQSTQFESTRSIFPLRIRVNQFERVVDSVKPMVPLDKFGTNDGIGFHMYIHPELEWTEATPDAPKSSGCFEHGWESHLSRAGYPLSIWNRLLWMLHPHSTPSLSSSPSDLFSVFPVTRWASRLTDGSYVFVYGWCHTTPLKPAKVLSATWIQSDHRVTPIDEQFVQWDALNQSLSIQTPELRLENGVGRVQDVPVQGSILAPKDIPTNKESIVLSDSNTLTVYVWLVWLVPAVFLLFILSMIVKHHGWTWWRGSPARRRRRSLSSRGG